MQKRQNGGCAKASCRVSIHSNRLQFLLVVSLSWLAFLYSKNWIAALGCPLSIEYEGSVFWQCHMAATGQNIYDPSWLSSFPAYAAVYTPIFIWLGACLMKVCGPVYWCLRAISMLSFLMVCWIFGCIMRRAACSRVQSLIAITCFASFFWTLQFSCYARVDMLALMLSLLSLQSFLRSFGSANSHSARSYVVSIVISAVAFAAKQTAIALPMGLVLFLLVERRYRLAVEFGTISILGILVAGTTLQLVTGGYLQHTGVASSMKWDPQLVRSFVMDILPLYYTDKIKLLSLLMVIATGYVVNRSTRLETYDRLPLALLIASSALALLLSGFPGVWNNHAIFPGLSLSWLVARSLRGAANVLAPLVLVICLWGSEHFQGYTAAVVASLPHDTERLSAGIPGKPVLAEDPQWVFVNGGKPVISDCCTLLHAWSHHESGQLKRLTYEIERQRFAAIVINLQDHERHATRIWPPQVLDTIQARYRPAGLVPGNGMKQVLYVPRSEIARAER